MHPYIGNVTFDCVEPAEQAEFWASVLGWEVQVEPPEVIQGLRGAGFTEEEMSSEASILHPEGRGEHPFGVRARLYFNRVPEAKSGKNRVHMDINAEDRRAEVERLVQLGATKLRDVERVAGAASEAWTVMQDPEGNEFCVQGP